MVCDCVWKTCRLGKDNTVTGTVRFSIKDKNSFDRTKDWNRVRRTYESQRFIKKWNSDAVSLVRRSSKIGKDVGVNGEKTI